MNAPMHPSVNGYALPRVCAVVNFPGDIAQLEERLHRTQEANGSTPLISTTFLRFYSSVAQLVELPAVCLGLMKSHTSIGRNQLINKRDEINPKSI